MRNILICPIKAVLAEIPSSSAFYILCSSYEQNLGQFGNALILRFFDTQNPCNPYAFTNADAKKVLSFFDNTPSEADVFISCDSGESRSPAIAAALKKYQGESDSNIWDSPEYHPNSFVYHICCECFQSMK